MTSSGLVSPVAVETNHGKKRTSIGVDAASVVLVMTVAILTMLASSMTYVGHADNFTDLFYTNAFRGSFQWIEKLDWIGMVVQVVISCFSLFGVALMTIRIMTSLLYLSSKGIWEEVHDLKQSGGESDMYDLGVVNMAKSWAKGKAGTGLDAIIGAILIILPDVKKYSDFGEKSNGDFDENMSVSQYMLKIALPTVLTVFFFAMGFNGTLWQALAVTVDAMGTAADKAVSVNYAGFVQDLVASMGGYKFSFSGQNTNIGKLQNSIASDIYGRAVQEMPGAATDQLYQIGLNIEKWVTKNITYAGIGGAAAGKVQITSKIQTGLTTGNKKDDYAGYLGYNIIVNTNPTAEGSYKDLKLNGSGGDTNEPEPFKDVQNMQDVSGITTKYVHLFITQSNSYSGSFFNTSENMEIASGSGTGS